MTQAAILIVEDEAIVAADLAGKLRQLGYHVAGSTASGAEAVALAASTACDLVLMDISLGGSQDGIQAAEAIRRARDVPVIYLTAHSDPATLAQAKITDPFGYILKPFEERELATQIELALYKHQADRQVREQREWLRVTLTSIGDAVVAADAQGRITFVNAVAAALTGWTAEESVGQPVECVFRMVNEQTGEPLEDLVARVLRENRAVELANHAALVTRDSRTVPIEDSAAPIRDAAGQTIGAVLVFHDVTEKRRAQEAQHRLAQFPEQNPNPILRIAPDGELLYANSSARAWLASLGGPADGHLPEAIRQLVQQTYRQGRVTEAEISSPAGVTLWISAVQPPGEDYVNLYGRDVTDRKRVEEGLRQANEQWERTFDSVPDLIVILDEQHRVVRANQAMARRLGTTPKQCVGLPCYAAVHDADAPPSFCPHARTIADFQVHTEEVHEERLGGDFLVTTTPLTDEQGRFQGAVHVARDITERKRAEQRTRLLSEITAELLASDRPKQIVETLCRRVMEHLDCQAFFNFLLEESSGRLHLNACAGVSAETTRRIEWLDLGAAVCGCVARDGCRIVAENIQTTPDPRTDLVRSLGIQAYACHPLINEGRTIGTLSFGSRTKRAFSDDDLELMRIVTAHVAIAMQRIRLLEASERHAREAQAANAAKSQFLANMSHELRTPMNAILGMIDVALPKAVDPVVQDCLEAAKGSADLLLMLLNDLLDSAKIESGKLELDPHPFSLRRMLDQMARVLAVRASEKGLTFVWRVSDDTPDAVVGDRIRLQQVLLNLAGNAIKFTERGEVEVQLRRVLPSPSGRGAGGEGDLPDAKDAMLSVNSPHPNPLPEGEGTVTLEFAVRDTGIGIPAERLEHIFEPFAQADASMTRRFGGTGLGLSISRSLVELMGGRLRVESQLGQGSVFAFTLRLPPAQEPPVDFEIPAPLPAVPAAVLRILLVEDNPANQKVATYVLRDRGHTVEVAADGPQAVRLCCANRYDVILMDVQMPGMNGLEATAAIREAEQTSASADPSPRHVPIIAMTAHAMPGDRQRCLAAGMDGYLSKPINAREMIGLVERLALGGPGEGSPAAADPAPGPPAIFDPALALARCMDDPNMVQEMAQCFRDDLASLLPQMRAALGRGDLAEVGRLGHRLKGTLVYLGAEPAHQAATAVEDFAVGRGDPAQAEALVERLQQQCAALQTVLPARGAGC